MSLQIANYRGKSPISKAIRLLTYSCYSHSAVRFTEDLDVQVANTLHFIPAGSVIEAWTSGVRMVESLSSQHDKGTIVDLFETKIPLTKEQEQKIAACLVLHLGTKYSYGNVLRFVPIVRLIMPEPLPFSYTRTHVFCDELVLEAFAAGGVLLLERCKFWEVPPRDVPRSPLVFLKDSAVTT